MKMEILLDITEDGEIIESLQKIQKTNLLDIIDNKEEEE
jgi:hypothetical protein